MATSPHPTEWASTDPAILDAHAFTPMRAASALFSHDSADIPEAIIASLSRQIFDGEHLKPSSRFRRWMAKLTLHILKRTTRAETQIGSDGREVVVYRNRLIERSDYAYALNLLRPSDAESASFVEGGDSMIAPYMMILPEVRRNACRWDGLFLDSVIGRDVQIRFIWETKFTYEIASERLRKGEPVRLKAAAAGTGLSLILVYDRLIREGHDPSLITAIIADRATENVAKAGKLLETLATTRQMLATDGDAAGISTRIEDLLHEGDGSDGETSVTTLIGILEYFHGFTRATSEEFWGETSIGDEAGAKDLLRKIGESTAESGILIANSYKVESGARLLEAFGKRFRFRHRDDLHELVRTAGFVPAGRIGSGVVYDVETFVKQSD